MIMGLPLGSYYFSHVKVINIFPDYEVSQDAIGEMDSGYFYCHINSAWKSIKKDVGKKNGCNIILHEFAHSLDLLDRIANGFPGALLNKDESQYWNKYFSSEYILNTSQGKKIWKYLALSRWSQNADYPSEGVDIAEMFAVATEKYFEDTAKLNKISPEIYQLLDIVYKQNLLQNINNKKNIIERWSCDLREKLTRRFRSYRSHH